MWTRWKWLIAVPWEGSTLVRLAIRSWETARMVLRLVLKWWRFTKFGSCVLHRLLLLGFQCGRACSRQSDRDWAKRVFLHSYEALSCFFNP